MAETSSFPLLEFVARYENGISAPVAGATVKVYDATNAVDLPDLETDSEGMVAPGNLDVAIGTTIRVRVENHLGLAGAGEFVTLEPI